MLLSIAHIIRSKKIILASGSPRRKEILSNAGLKVDIIPSKFEENLDKTTYKDTFEYAIDTSYHKGLEVVDRMINEGKEFDLVIAADTIVTMNDKIFEKPRSMEDAVEMLKGFRGLSHVVYTGVTLIFNEGGKRNIERFHCGTQVKFSNVDLKTIEAYVSTGESMDKAGGYGIQALGGSLVEEIKGDYFNVMGLPLNSLFKRIYDHYQANSD
ncbi:DgyrCDS12215 [Dimorphilus gyrociliatus]|uniref:DgyrCDS12215 n=1 Tax=Dimorphilus gyrociliatus TaxID=2664684 RepID=A0A7I8W5W4_9ANNE|nr:DgyrCDS12215 [Dimorphilus gyrociliatus]